MNPLKRLRGKRADRREKRDRARAKYKRTGKGGREVRRHQKALVKILALISRIKRAPRQITENGVTFIKSFEGFSPKPVNIGDGVLTYGYGHTEPLGSKVPMSISEPAAARLLGKDLDADYVPAVRKLFEKGGPLHGKFAPWRLDALVSVAYNLGVGAVLPYPHPGFETLGAAIQSGNLRRVADALPLYCNPGSQFEEGLRRRRRCEARLLLTGNYSTEI